jgi:hypothetical protein
MTRFLKRNKEMKVFITIEETISDTFEIEENSVDKAVETAKSKYNSGEFIVESGNVTNRMIYGREENSEEGTEWIKF